MSKWIVAAVGALVFVSLLQLSCKDQMVGAPCIPETDKGDFSATLSGTTWSIETRSVQCETRLCVTKTQSLTGLVDEAQIAACTADPTLANCWEGDDGMTQAKYSFCSCRCKDINGKAGCQCPPNTKCVEVLGDIQEAPAKVKGSYCVPNCMASGDCYSWDKNNDGDIEKLTCMPSKDSEKPWQWKCTEFDPTE
jgi:hypothetical protein